MIRRPRCRRGSRSAWEPLAGPGASGAWHPLEVDLSAYAGWRFSLFYQPYRRTWTLVFSAEELAREIAGFPPIAMTSDRQSAYESFDRDQASAVRREMELSLAARHAESQKGAARFAGGQGRHGKFEGR